jgi:hypothetical protein
MKNHFLPKMYLKGFSSSGKVFVFFRSEQTIKELAPVSICKKRELYTLRMHDGTKNHAIEKNLLARNESRVRHVIEKLNQRKILDRNEQLDLCEFVAFLAIRVPATLSYQQQIAEQRSPKVLQELFPDINTTLDFIRKSGDFPVKADEKMAKFIFERVQRKQLTVKVDDDFALANLPALGNSMMKAIWQLNWTVVWAPSKCSFITSDCPFVVLSPANRTIRRLGVRCPNTLTFVPLSSTCAIILEPLGDNRDYKVIPRPLVNSINMSVAINSDRFVIARDKPLLERVVKRTRLNVQPQKDN